MHNVEWSISPDEVLTIVIDLKAIPRRSKNQRRKNMVVASTDGSKPLVGSDGRFRRESINMSIWREAEKGELWPHEMER